MRRLLNISLLTFAVATALVGCAGTTFDPTPYTGDYNGSGAVDRGKTGTLTFTSNAQGVISGTFVVSGTEGMGTGYNFAVGTYPVAGSITSTSGDYQVTGTVTEQGAFSIRGKFPSLGSPKTYTIRAGAETFTGTLNRS